MKHRKKKKKLKFKVQNFRIAEAKLVERVEWEKKNSNRDKLQLEFYGVKVQLLMTQEKVSSQEQTIVNLTQLCNNLNAENAFLVSFVMGIEGFWCMLVLLSVVLIKGNCAKTEIVQHLMRKLLSKLKSLNLIKIM